MLLGEPNNVRLAYHVNNIASVIRHCQPMQSVITLVIQELVDQLRYCSVLLNVGRMVDMRKIYSNQNCKLRIRHTQEFHDGSVKNCVSGEM